MFKVRGKKSALDDLTSLWVQGDSAMRKAITAATYQIENVLKESPEDEGESRGENERVMFAFPLGINYRVFPEQNIVRVRHVWTYQRRAK